jgi:DegV family protein with EDD domain
MQGGTTMSLTFLVDSGSDVDEAMIQQNQLKVIPLRTYFGDEEFLDGVTITREEFYDRLVSDPHHPTTSQPSPDDFLTAFQAAKEVGDEVIAILLSGRLSGTVQSARIAAEECDYDRIYLVDSENVTLGARILIQLACQLRDAGKSAPEIVEILNKEKKRVRVMASLETLHYLQRGGRISKAVATAGTLLSIKPIIAIENGEVALIGKARGAKNSERLLAKLIENYGGVDFSMPFSLAYSGNSRSHLEEYVEAYEDLWHGKIDELPIGTIGSTIGVHVGPGAIGIAFFSNEETNG